MGWSSSGILASTLGPIRTINGRLSSRMLRRYQILAARFPREWGLDMVGAHAVSLDPDPQRLRGIVALGIQSSRGLSVLATSSAFLARLVNEDSARLLHLLGEAVHPCQGPDLTY